MLWENVSRLDWCLSGPSALWNLGSNYSRNGHYPSYFRSYDCLSDFLETRKLVSLKIRKKEVGHLGQPPFEYDIIVL